MTSTDFPRGNRVPRMKYELAEGQAPTSQPLAKTNASYDADRTIELLRERLENERHRFDALQVDLQNLQADVIAKNREIGRLKGEITKREGTSTTMVEVREVWDHYVAKVAKRSDVVFGDGRKKMIRDRLRECRESNVSDPVARLKRAIDGLAARPYVRNGGGRTSEPKNAKRYAQLQHALRSDEQVDAAISWLEPEQPDNVRQLRPRRQTEYREPPVSLVLRALEKLDLTWRVASGGRQSWSAQCPAHEDRDPSLSIREASDGKVLLNCFAGCDVIDVVGALGLSLTDLFPRSAA